MNWNAFIDRLGLAKQEWEELKSEPADFGRVFSSPYYMGPPVGDEPEFAVAVDKQDGIFHRMEIIGVEIIANTIYIQVKE